MSGVLVVRYLLASAGAVTAVVPATRIKAGELPINTVMPAIAITQISSAPYLTVNVNEANRMHTDRVQVTVFRKVEPDDRGYPGLKTLLDLILATLTNRRATVNGVTVDSIVPDIEGPDLSIPDLQVVTRSRDFLVRWTA